MEFGLFRAFSFILFIFPMASCSGWARFSRLSRSCAAIHDMRAACSSKPAPDPNRAQPFPCTRLRLLLAADVDDNCMALDAPAASRPCSANVVREMRTEEGIESLQRIRSTRRSRCGLVTHMTAGVVLEAPEFSACPRSEPRSVRQQSSPPMPPRKEPTFEKFVPKLPQATSGTPRWPRRRPPLLPIPQPMRRVPA